MSTFDQLKSFVKSLIKAAKRMGQRLSLDSKGSLQAPFAQSQLSSVGMAVGLQQQATSIEVQVQAPMPAANDSTPVADPITGPITDPTTDAELLTPQTSEPQAEKQAEAQVPPPPQSSWELPPQAPTFTHSVFMFEDVPYPYSLYIPSGPATMDSPDPAVMPLLVLLHGCTQNAADFARGTAMNVLAEKNHCMVLYPEQIAKSNSAKCWNWYEPEHQQSGRGEPGLIAAMTQSVLASDYLHRKADPDRVYIAGLSAGGAMAAMVSSLYPDIFAALGVHSGLAAGSAQSLMTAFGAMRQGAKGSTIQALPTIVFHGTADKTVHPNNGEFITEAALTALVGKGLSLEKSHSTINGATEKTTDRITERTDYRAANGLSYVEHWLVDAGSHAWSGGDATGTYTDPVGPSASAAMLAFFLQHHKQPSNSALQAGDQLII